jgi:hypothetical protein
MDDYLAFYGNVGQLLVQMAPLLVPSGTSCAEMAEDDAAASLAERTVGTLCAFTLNGHLLKIRDKDLQKSFLQQLAACLGIEYLPVAVLTLPAWRRLVQGHERQVNDGGEGQQLMPSMLYVCCMLAQCGVNAQTLLKFPLVSGAQTDNLVQDLMKLCKPSHAFLVYLWACSCMFHVPSKASSTFCDISLFLSVQVPRPTRL